jgi:hypothetical protein
VRWEETTLTTKGEAAALRFFTKQHQHKLKTEMKKDISVTLKMNLDGHFWGIATGEIRQLV